MHKGRDGRPRKPNGPPPESQYESVHLAKEVVAELRATARPGKGDILVKVFAEAVAAFAAEDFEEAVRLGEQAKHIALRAIGPREFLGLAYYKLGRFRDAARELAAFRRLSGSTDQNPVLADSYRALEKPDKALTYVDEVTRAAPPEVYYESQIVAAGALSDMGRTAEAIARLETLDLDPVVAEPHHVRAWYALGDLLERSGRFTQARDLFEAADSADPGATDAGSRADRLRASR
ncbi:MAG TPA: tetratricopeptide repeat protein [Actinomycetota bacterium]|nr:tetratricopeptide repeat protein [Actinomycetota bacterium]